MGLGAKEVRVLVRNLANDALSLVVTPIEVIDLSRAGLSVLPPLFVDRSRDWLSTRLAGEVPEGPSRSLADALGTEFFPALEPVLRPGRRREVVLALFYRGPTPRLQIRVLTPLGEAVEGAKVDLVRRLLGDEQGLGLVATLRPKDLRPGGYLLEVALVDPESGRRVANRTRFVVEEPS